MKVLMLTPYLPYPLMSGGQTRSYNLIKDLSNKHEITLFSLIKNEEETKYIPELEKFCKKVRVFKRPKTPWNVRNIFLTGFGPFPFLVIRNLAPNERRAVSKEIQEGDYDLIHAETFYVMPHIPRTNIPILLVEQTVEYLVYKHYVVKQAPFFVRPILWIDILKLRFWETYYWRRSKKVVAMSDSDRAQMMRLEPSLDIEIVPNGIDIEYFSQKTTDTKTDPRVLYVGNFTWLQNEEAVEVLVKKVWPKIQKEINNAKLWIVGTNMTSRIKNMARRDIIVTEGIKDIRDAYKKANVLVAPIQGPGGTRLKILEAMASSLPVVTTPTGAEGLGIKDGEEAIIRESSLDLANAAVKVLTDIDLSNRLGGSGMRFVREHYAWKKSALLLDMIYKNLVHGKS